ncbi:insulin-like growth factor-binding protein 3 receptor isoform X2 [Anolis carolinensis]|uniref:insulin-like growth factor-binding protein 3 receptor isoform X2 n=1 Tax=Anolis carolinensis TaxID=28377 RepID=UPI002F2B44C7
MVEERRKPQMTTFAHKQNGSPNFQQMGPFCASSLCSWYKGQRAGRRAFHIRKQAGVRAHVRTRDEHAQVRLWLIESRGAPFALKGTVASILGKACKGGGIGGSWRQQQDGGLNMIICSLLGSLRVCLERHPPLVTFFFCLLSLAVAFIGFAAYIQSHEVQNPDVKEDWNSLLQSLAQLMFCVPNKTQDASPPPTTTTIAESHITISIMVGFSFDLHNGTDPPNGTHLSLTVSGTELGLKGPDAQEAIHVLAVIMNSISRESCLSIIAPLSLFPKTRQPLTCVIDERDMHLQEPGICYQSHYQTNPALSSMLDQADRALCSQRLLLTGAFLLCLCAMLCCAAGLCYPLPREKRGQI